MAVRLSSLLAARGVELAVADVMEHRSVRGLVDVLVSRGRDGGNIEEKLRAAVLELTSVAEDGLEATTDLGALGIDSVRLALVVWQTAF
jgi:hypothetical protein